MQKIGVGRAAVFAKGVWDKREESVEVQCSAWSAILEEHDIQVQHCSLL